MKSTTSDWSLLSLERYADKYVGRFVNTNVGRQPIPGMERYQEDNCEVIYDNVTGKHYLMVPGSGSMYFDITTEEANRYFNK
jgi:hypothetical protein